MKNEGKRFEEDFKNSVPDDMFYYRFRDGTSSWDGGNARFQAKNICDCMIMTDTLFLLELKSTKSKSLPFTMIRDNNLDDMIQAQDKESSNILSYLIVNFRELEQTYYVPCWMVKDFMNESDRKSIPIKWFKEMMNNTPYVGVMPQEKKRVRYRYSMDYFLTT